MKSTLAKKLLAVSVLMCVLPWGLALAQCLSCGQTKVKVRFFCRADGVHNTTLGGKTVSGDSGGPFSTHRRGLYHEAGYSTSPTGVAELELDKAYTLEASGDAGCYHINLSCAACYVVKINGVEGNDVDLTPLGVYARSYQVVITTRQNTEGGEGGGAGSAGSGDGGVDNGAQWKWDLGGSGAGTDAGALRLDESSLTAASYTPAALMQTVAGEQVETIKAGAYLRQVRTPEGLADIVTVDADTFELRFYGAGQVGGEKDGSGHYPVTGAASVVWRVELPDGGIVGQDLRITELRGGNTVVNDFLFNPGSQTWILTQGGLRKEIQTQTVLPNGDVEVVTTVAHAVTGVVASQRKDLRHAFAWGTEVIATVNDPQGDALTTQYAFYTDPLVVGSYTRLKSVIYPNGSWEKLEYYSETVADIHVQTRSGVVKYRMRPWLGSPATPDAAVAAAPATPGDPTTGNCRVTAYDYRGYEPNLTEVLEVREYVTGILIGQRKTPDDNETRTYRNAAQWTAAKEFRMNVWGGWPYAGRLDATSSATGQKVDWSYERGIFNAAPLNDDMPDARSFSFNNVGWAVRTVEDESVAALFGPVAQRSLRRESVVDALGLKAYQETYVFDGAEYQPLSRVDYFYDAQQHLIRVEQDGRILREQSWDGDRLLTATDEAGITTTYGGYDFQGQATVETRVGVTTTTFDVLGRARVVLQTGVGLSLTQSTDYDIAGRVTSQTGINALTTGTDYSADGRTTTVAHPNGSTTITETYLDGQVKSITGTAVVAEFYHRTVDATTGFLTTRVYQGFDLSPRWSETTTDWAGNVVADKRSGQSSPLTTTHGYNAAGQRESSTASGAAPRRFEYDELGEPLRQGMDLGANGRLDAASIDRQEESTRSFELTAGAWYEVSTRKAWLTNNNTTATTVQTTKRKITGLGATTLSDVTLIDEQNQATRIIKTVDRATATVTVTTTSDRSNQTGVQVYRAGLLFQESSTQAAAGSDVFYEYYTDGKLKRSYQKRMVASVEQQVELVYQEYETNGQLKLRRSAEAGEERYMYYPAGHMNAGMLQQVTNAVNETTLYTYDLLGRVKTVRGTAAQPVDYDYNSLGELERMTTYRTMNLARALNGASHTDWYYEPATGLLRAKVPDAPAVRLTPDYAVAFALANPPPGTVQYRYDSYGKLYQKKNAREEVATYGRDSATGDLLTVEQDAVNTPDLMYGVFDRLGRPQSITDGSGVRSLTYRGLNSQPVAVEYTAGPLMGVKYEKGFGLDGRADGLTVTRGAATDYDVDLGYDALGRVGSIGVPGLAAVTYGYEARTNSVNDTRHYHVAGGADPVAAAAAYQVGTTASYTAGGRLEAITTLGQPAVGGPAALTGMAFGRDGMGR